MPEEIEEIEEIEEASALDAIEAIAIEGSQRAGSGWQKYGLYLTIAVMLVCVLVAGYIWHNRPAQLANTPVAVLLPQKDSGPVADNAARQWQGFSLAFKKNRVVDEDQQHVHHFNYPLSLPDGRNEIIARIQRWYGEGIRTFVITMSGAMDIIKDEFVNWANTLPPGDRPVLVATVASAPGLADRQHGVFRHYIRSRDETSIIATYVESLEATEVYVFYVKDTYGIEAKKILQKRLQNSVFKGFGVAVKFDLVAEKVVDEAVATILRKTTSRENAVVVIVGYGPMINHTLVKLRDTQVDGEEKFKGKILVVSTFTEEEWRPEDLSGTSPDARSNRPFARRIYTVGPVHDGSTSKNPGVVYQFSYHTLDRALRCGDRRGIEAFWKCWSNRKAPNQDYLEVPGVDVEFTEDGDSLVSLRLLNYSEW